MVGFSRTRGPFAGGLVDALRMVRAAVNGAAMTFGRQIAPVCGRRKRGIVDDITAVIVVVPEREIMRLSYTSVKTLA